MNDEIINELFKREADEVYFVDISNLPKEQTLGFDKAIIFFMVLSKEYITDKLNSVTLEGVPYEESTDEFLIKEQKAEELADWLSGYLKQKGYNTHSQSEKNNSKSGYIESVYIDPNLQQGISILPQKAIARIAGLGFIGKNNLLITEEYGCALCMCSMLTNAPVVTKNRNPVPSKCGTCEICAKNCPASALHNKEWTLEGGRESIFDVSKCCCALKCLVLCPWTQRYASK